MKVHDSYLILILTGLAVHDLFENQVMNLLKKVNVWVMVTPSLGVTATAAGLPYLIILFMSVDLF